jgi:GT2 family glycosyltransferase
VALADRQGGDSMDLPRGGEAMMHEQPTVTFVMITHDRKAEVLRSLGHLSRLPEGPPIILVDNGSTDGTVAAAAREFPGVRIEVLSSNRGAWGRTVGVTASATPYVAFCDDDTWWRPGALDLAARLFDRHPRLAVITGRILIGPEEREDPICRRLERSPLPAEPDIPGYPLLGFLAGASVVRRSTFLEAGGFESR